MTKLTGRICCGLAWGATIVLLICVLAATCHGDPIDATVRLTSQAGFGVQNKGTGTVFRVDPEAAWILTCRHVVGNAQVMGVEFWHAGWQSSRPVEGSVVARGQSTDSAVVRVARSALGGYEPSYVPLATVVPTDGATVVSVGCAGGSWPTLWRGHLVQRRQYDDSAVPSWTFQPPPAGGRSGAAILDATGSQIVAVLRARDDEAGVGIADPIDAVAADLRISGANQTSVTMLVPLDTGRWRASTPAQYRTENGNAQCPGPYCPQQQAPGSTPGGLFDWFGAQKQQPNQQPPPGGQLFDAPPFVETPPAPQVDLGAALERLDAIQGKIAEVEGQIGQAQSAAQTPDPTLLSTLAEQRQALAALQAQVAALPDKAALDATASDLKQTTITTGTSVQATVSDQSTSLASKIKTLAVWGGGGLAALMFGGPVGIGLWILRKLGAEAKKDIKDYRDSGGANKTYLQILAEKLTPGWTVDDAIAKWISDKLAAGDSKVDQAVDAAVARMEALLKQQQQPRAAQP